MVLPQQPLCVLCTGLAPGLVYATLGCSCHELRIVTPRLVNLLTST